MIDWYNKEEVNKATIEDCVNRIRSHDLCEYCSIALERLEKLIKELK